MTAWNIHCLVNDDCWNSLACNTTITPTEYYHFVFHDYLMAWIRFLHYWPLVGGIYYTDVIMSAMASQITVVSIVYSAVCSGADQRKHQSSASLAFEMGIHRWPVVYLQKGPMAQKMFLFDDVFMPHVTLENWILHCNVKEENGYVILFYSNVGHTNVPLFWVLRVRQAQISTSVYGDKHIA